MYSIYNKWINGASIWAGLFPVVVWLTVLLYFLFVACETSEVP